jgi:glycosyltransferase involved in cell wall biosynthesis
LDQPHPAVDISIVFPCKNEEPTIGEAIENVRKAFEGINVQIIVSDSSTDRTPEIARNLGALVVTPSSLGYGAAYRYGFDHCRGRIIGMADPDGTYDVLEMPGMVELLIDGGNDLVMGSRLRGEMEPGAMPAFKRHFGNPFLTWMLNLLFSVGISDAHCGMRVFSRDALDRMDLKTTGMEFASEMLVEAKRADLKIAEIPIRYRRRKGAPSKLSSLGDGWRHIRYMLAARMGRA